MPIGFLCEAKATMDVSPTAPSPKHRVSRQGRSFGVSEVNRKENRHRHRFAVQFGRDESKIFHAGDRRRVEWAVPARLVDARGIGNCSPVDVDEQAQSHVALKFSRVECGGIVKWKLGVDYHGW